MSLPITCPVCHGDKTIERDVSYGDYTTAEAWNCPGCEKKGRVWTAFDGEPPTDDVLVEFHGIVDQWAELDADQRAEFLGIEKAKEEAA